MKVYAHRGYSGQYPENTMLAFQKAAESIDRTTDGSGWVRDYTLKELKKFNANKLHSDKTQFEAIPTFEEYCQWASKYDLVTNVELKTGVYYYEEIEEKTLELVKKYHLENRVLFFYIPGSKFIAMVVPCLMNQNMPRH